MIKKIKLCLSINSEIVDNAKQYADQNHMTLSELIENQLIKLTNPNKITLNKPIIGPITKGLIGVIKLPEKHFPEY